jgi:hypothetical protein
LHSRFSERTFRLVADAVTKFYTLRTIDDEFESVGLKLGTPKGEVYGDRRTRLRAYLDPVDQHDYAQVARISEAFAAILQALSTIETNGKYEGLIKSIERDGFTYSESRLIATRTAPANFIVSGVDDLDNLRFRVERLTALVDEHPAEAIGGAKELVESVCRTIIRLCDAPTVSKTADLIELAKATMKVLELVPADVDDAKKGVDTVRRCLQQLGAVVATLGELRNLYGSGHGKDGKWRGLGPRHARLAVGAATTIAVFFSETYLERYRTLADPSVFPANTRDVEP